MACGCGKSKTTTARAATTAAPAAASRGGTIYKLSDGPVVKFKTTDPGMARKRLAANPGWTVEPPLPTP